MRPYFLQPDKFLPYLSFKRQTWPSSVTTEFYLSFEDALWSLLPRLGYKKGSLLLFPEFYCPDVLHNIEQHGYKTSLYPINSDLSVNPKKVAAVISKMKPDIFIDFAPAGVPNGISDAIFRKLPFHSLVILDRVHSLVTPTVDYFPPTDRYLLLNSYRKVSPFPGAIAVFSRNAHRYTPVRNTPYIIRGLWYWFRYLLTLQLSRFLFSTKLATYAFKRYLTDHDALIGDAAYSPQLPGLFRFLTELLPVQRIRECKVTQVQIYRQTFSKYLAKCPKILWDIADSPSYEGELRGFPLIIKEPYATTFLEKAQKFGLSLYAQLDDNNWSKKQKLILLPIGPQFTDRQIKHMIAIAEKALTATLQCDIITA